MAFLVGLPWLLSSSWSAHSLTGVALLGVFQLGLSYYFYTKAIPHVTALEAVLIPVVEPILNPVWVYLVMGESPSPLALIGAGVIVSAVTWRALVRLNQQREIESQQRSYSEQLQSVI
jgi:drug/metabolite transporter (DMT)-like permease